MLSNKQRTEPIQRRHLFGGAFFYRQSRINPLFLAQNVAHRDHIDTAFRSDRAFRQRKAFSVINFKSKGDKPAPDDYNEDGKIDITLFHPSTGDYFSLRSSDGAFRSVHWSQAGDIPIGASPQ